MPNPDDLLSERTPSAAICSANKEVKDLIDAKPSSSRKRGPYQNYTDKEKAQIGKRAAEFGVTNTLKHFGKQFANYLLNESTMRTWMMNYKKEFASQVKTGRRLVI